MKNLFYFFNLFFLKILPTKKLLSFLLFSFFLLSQHACNTTEPNNNLSLSLDDVNCTEAWIRVNGETGAEVTLTRDDKEVQKFTLTSSSQTVYDDSLLPNKTYSYQAVQNNEISSKIPVTTLDTTNSNFDWQLYTFGDFNATGRRSVLYGVTILNENDIWVVGRVYTGDSAGTFNAVHWDGEKWNLISIPLEGSCNGGVLYPELLAISRYSDKEILVSDGGALIKYDGTTATPDCRMNNLLNGAVNGIYVQNSNSIYLIGYSGTIVHFDSQHWNKIESGTSLNLSDIYSNNGNDIYIGGADLLYNQGGILLKGNANGFETVEEGKSFLSSDQLFNPYFAGVARTVWATQSGTVYFGGNLLYRYKNGKTDLEKTLPGNYLGGNATGQYWGFLSQIRGLAENQMILVGENNTIRYFNGVNWKQIGMPYDLNSNFIWLSAAMTNDLIVVVGYSAIPENGIIMMLKRQ
jgi:hypothetical protein